MVLEWGPLPRWHGRSFGFGENLKLSCWRKIRGMISLALFFAFSRLTWWSWLCYNKRIHGDSSHGQILLSSLPTCLKYVHQKCVFFTPRMPCFPMSQDPLPPTWHPSKFHRSHCHCQGRTPAHNAFAEGQPLGCQVGIAGGRLKWTRHV